MGSDGFIVVCLWLCRLGSLIPVWLPCGIFFIWEFILRGIFFPLIFPDSIRPQFGLMFGIEKHWGIFKKLSIDQSINCPSLYYSLFTGNFFVQFFFAIAARAKTYAESPGDIASHRDRHWRISRFPQQCDEPRTGWWLFRLSVAFYYGILFFSTEFFVSALTWLNKACRSHPAPMTRCEK